MTRRRLLVFTAVRGVGLVFIGCTWFRSPSSPSESSSGIVRSPDTGNELKLPQGSWIRSGVSGGGSILAEVRSLDPVLSPPNGTNPFVRGFSDTIYSDLVFFANGRPFDDLGVGLKQLPRGADWGCQRMPR